MADQANVVVYNDASTPVLTTFIPTNPGENQASWVEQSSSKSQMAKGRLAMKQDKARTGLTRRLFKVELPIMETAAAVGGDMHGNVAAPKVAYIVPAQVQVFVPERATDQDVANALKMLINAINGDETAGTGGAVVGSTVPVKQFLVQGIIPD